MIFINIYDKSETNYHFIILKMKNSCLPRSLLTPILTRQKTQLIFNPKITGAYRARGITLIELIVTVGIIGILAAIAIPAYSAYTKRAKITDGLTILKSTAHTMELDYTTTSVYECRKSNWRIRNFNFACSTSANGYTITANGLGDIANYSYSINAAGERKTLSHPAGTSNDCWLINNSC